MDTQVGGTHYDMVIQPMEFSIANDLDACQHTIIKYVSRFKAKNGLEDLKKALHTIDLYDELIDVSFLKDEWMPRISAFKYCSENGMSQEQYDIVETVYNLQGIDLGDGLEEAENELICAFALMREYTKCLIKKEYPYADFK